MFKPFEEKNIEAAKDLNNNVVLPLCKPLFAEQNLGPLRGGLVLIGRIKTAYCRKPLSLVTDGTKKALKQTMQSSKIFK